MDHNTPMQVQRILYGDPVNRVLDRAGWGRFVSSTGTAPGLVLSGAIVDQPSSIVPAQPNKTDDGQ